jgi:hypothetical protein
LLAALAISATLLLAGHWAAGGQASAQEGPRLILSADPATLSNGDDFATTVLGDPWDMDKRRDIGWEENFSDIRIENGIWSARIDVTNPAAGSSGYVFPLFQGFRDALYVGNIGARYPIDTSRYTLLSYRLYMPQRGGAQAVYWTHSIWWPDGSDFFAFADGGGPGWRIYMFDMTATNGDPGHQRGSWQSGPVYGLRIDPDFTSRDKEVKIDWVRLCDPSTSPRYLLTWQMEGLASPSGQAELFIDTDASGYDGSAIARISLAAGRYEFPTCALAAGEYYFYLKYEGALSNYAGPLVINGTPFIRWDLSTVGQDYAREELGDPWDMDGPHDLANLRPEMLRDEYYALRQFYGWQFNDGIFSAVADSSYAYQHYSSERQSDVQVWLNVSQERPIDPLRYRYLVIRMMVEDNDNRTLSQRVQDGWVGRIVWWNEGIEKDGQCTDEFIIYEGWQTYVVDLGERERPFGHDPYPTQRPWREMGTVRHLRFDPLEVSRDTRFHIDEVRLMAVPEVDASLTLTVGVGGGSGRPVSLALFMDRDASGFDGFALSPYQAPSVNAFAPFFCFLPLTLNRPGLSYYPLLGDGDVTMQRVSVPTAAVAPGVYYVYVCASAGDAQTCRYLPEPVRVIH